MSRKVPCLNNAEMESYFGIMKAEMMEEHYDTKLELEAALQEWLELYNFRCVKSRLKGKSPVDYQKFALQEAA